MHIIPALYLSNSHAVSHYKGKIEHSKILSHDPVKAARQFAQQGAKVIHIIDVSDDPQGKRVNREVIKNIAKQTSLLIQYADATVSLAEIEQLLADGVDFVGLNQFSEQLLDNALAAVGPAKLFFTIRAQRSDVEGKPGVNVVDYGNDIVQRGMTHIVFRDLSVEGTLHPNFDEVERLILGTHAHIYSCGGVGSVKDLELLQRTGASGAIISRAFFERRLSLPECIKRFDSF